MQRKIPKDIDEYISWFPEEVQEKLNIIRNLIKQNAPDAEECISFNIPAFKRNGILLYFAGYQKHVSLYPAPRTHPDFEEELKDYKGGKGTVQFPLNKDLPIDLILRIIKYKVEKKISKLNL